MVFSNTKFNSKSKFMVLRDHAPFFRYYLTFSLEHIYFRRVYELTTKQKNAEKEIAIFGNKYHKLYFFLRHNYIKDNPFSCFFTHAS